MRKCRFLLVIALSLTLVSSACTVSYATSSRDSQDHNPASAILGSKAKKTTYIASPQAYHNGYGTVYLRDRNWRSKLYFKPKKGEEKVLLEDITDLYKDPEYSYPRDYKYFPYFNISRSSLFMKGKTVYLSDTPDEWGFYNNYPEYRNLYRIKSDGKVECLCSNAGDIIGGYGDDIIMWRKTKIKWNKKTNDYSETGDILRYSNGKIKKIGKASSNNYRSPVYIFEGKLYFNNKQYNLDTGKVRKFTASSIVTGKKCMYYVSGAKNLVRINKAGKRKYLAKNINQVIGGNTRNAICMTKGAKGLRYFMRVTVKGKVYKLTDENRMLRAGASYYKKVGRSYKYDKPYFKYKAFLSGGKVCIAALYSQAVITPCVLVPYKGGAVKLMELDEDITDNKIYLSRIDVIGNTLYYAEDKDLEEFFSCKHCTVEIDMFD